MNVAATSFNKICIFFNYFVEAIDKHVKMCYNSIRKNEGR